MFGFSKATLLLVFCRGLASDEEKMLNALATGRIIALIMDTNFVTYTAGQNVSWQQAGAIWRVHPVRLAGVWMACLLGVQDPVSGSAAPSPLPRQTPSDPSRLWAQRS